MMELPNQQIQANRTEANQYEYEQFSSWWLRFTPSTNYNHFLLFQA